MPIISPHEASRRLFYRIVVGANAPWLLFSRQDRLHFLPALLVFLVEATWLDYHPVWLVIAVFTLWSTYLLVFKKEVLYQKEVRKENRLTDPKLAAWKAETETVMQTRKPYLNPDLSLQTLAQMIGIKEKDLSEVLNIGFSKSFHDYVNQYRIEEVKKMLLDPDKLHLTNFALAQEAGFNSKSAFLGLFKKHVGMTPGEFKKKAPKG